MPRDGHTGRHQRVDGAARLAYARRGGVSALADLYQRAPCRLLFPDAGPDEPPQAVLLTTSGGLTGGDRLAVAVEVAASAAATVTAQAAEKLYRAGEDDCAVDIALTVGPGAWAEWLMQETILFDGARLRRRTAADIAPGGRLLAVESVVFGRAAMGEDFRRGLLHDSWRVRRGGRLVWADALRLEGDAAAARARPFGFGAAAGMATLVYAGDDAARHLDAARALIAATAASGGATCFDGLLLLRLLADDAAALRAAVIHVAAGLRAAAGGWPAALPRVWHC